jgi:septal ring factor EnvC (AmiA/AmiB activator)
MFRLSQLSHFSILSPHRQPEVFATQDNTLHEQIEAINQAIHTLNRKQEVRSPLLTVHLRARKQIGNYSIASLVSVNAKDMYTLFSFVVKLQVRSQI